MARTNLPLSTLVPNGVIDIPAGTTIDQANGMNVQLPTTAIPAAPGMDNLFLYVATTNGADKNVIIRAGVNPPAFRSSMGDLTVVAHTASGGGVVGPLESARFAQADGSINIDFASGITGKITAFIRPARW